MDIQQDKNIVITTLALWDTLEANNLNNTEKVLVIIELLNIVSSATAATHGKGASIELLNNIYNIAKDNLLDSHTSKGK